MKIVPQFCKKNSFKRLLDISFIMNDYSSFKPLKQLGEFRALTN
jgi:hypothetical protein